MRQTNDTSSFPPRRPRSLRRRGVAYLLAMLFIMMIAGLSLGFYASTTTGTQIANNQRQAESARLAAETGMDFMRFQLSRVSINAQNDVIASVRDDLVTQLNASSNLTDNVVTVTGEPISGGSSVGTVMDGAAIAYLQIPANGWIIADADRTQAFRATIRETGDHVQVTVDGLALTSPSIGRTVSMDFNRQQQQHSVFDFAVASKGKITLAGAAVQPTTGVDPLSITIMSALATGPSIDLTKPKSEVTGKLSIVDGGSVIVSAGTVAGSSIPGVILAEHVVTVDPPDFPAVDPSQYLKYATTTWNSGMTGTKKNAPLWQNVRIPRNSNVKLTGNVTIQGILYLEAPNTLEITGNVNLQGFIVMEDAGTDSQNVLSFGGNFSHNPLPNGTAFNDVRSVSGVSILAPKAAVNMTGSVDSYLRGNVIVSKFSMKGSSNITIDSGSLITYSQANDAVMLENNNKWLRFNNTGAKNLPSLGVSLSSYYKAIPDSYAELEPDLD